MTSTMRVFDPAMCCSTGVCGPSTDSILVRFAADLKWLEGHILVATGRATQTLPRKEVWIGKQVLLSVQRHIVQNDRLDIQIDITGCRCR